MFVLVLFFCVTYVTVVVIYCFYYFISDVLTAFWTPSPGLSEQEIAEKLDFILQFYAEFKEKLEQPLEKLGFDPELPESSLDQVDSVLTVKDVRSTNLAVFPDKYSGIRLFKTTLQVLQHRITYLSSSQLKNDKNAVRLINVNKAVIKAIDLTQLLQEYTTHIPDMVINGYWFYSDKLPTFGKRHFHKERSIIYIPPNAVKILEKLPQKGTFQFEGEFKIDKNVTFPLMAVEHKVEQLFGFAVFENLRPLMHCPTDENTLVTCKHTFSDLKNVLCSACGGSVTSYGDGDERVYCCDECGYCRECNTAIYCFCKFDENESDSEDEIDICM